MNDSKWSGEHASSDHEFTSGILFSNAPLNPGATLLDLGVTALTELGAQVLWNMFKKLCAARGSSDEEKAALFYGTAARVYKLGESAAL